MRRLKIEVKSSEVKKSRQEWSEVKKWSQGKNEEMKKARMNEEMKKSSQGKNEWRIEEAKNEVKKARSEEWMKKWRSQDE